MTRAVTSDGWSTLNSGTVKEEEKKEEASSHVGANEHLALNGSGHEPRPLGTCVSAIGGHAEHGERTGQKRDGVGRQGFQRRRLKHAKHSC